jgi:hypothetical protein
MEQRAPIRKKPSALVAALSARQLLPNKTLLDRRRAIGIVAAKENSLCLEYSLPSCALADLAYTGGRTIE